jgi:DNA-binding response OmpR family regulator
VDVFVGRVRRALEEVGAVKIIRTVRGGGYSLG